MTYLRSLFFNFLVVFFVDRVIPGIQVVDYEGVPDVINDVIFASIVAFCNASVFPTFYLLGVQASLLAMGMCCAVISYFSFFLILFVDVGVRAQNVLGVLLGGTIVFLLAFWSNYLEKKHFKQ